MTLVEQHKSTLDNIIQNTSKQARGFIKNSIETEIFNYRNFVNSEGDIDVEDSSFIIRTTMEIPYILFSDVIELFLKLNQVGIHFDHYYKSILKPYDCETEEMIKTWRYFDSFKDNTLRTEGSLYHKGNYIAIFYILEFNTYLVIGLNEKSNLIK